MIELARGSLSKMAVSLQAPVVQYSFRLDDTQVPVNPLIGQRLRLEYLPEEQRTGYMGPQECASKSAPIANILFKSDSVH